MKTKLFTLTCVGTATLHGAAVYFHGRNTVAHDSVAKKAMRATRLRALDAYGKIPLTFEENSGQTDARVKFLARGAGYTVFLTDRDATLRLEQPSSSARRRAQWSASRSRERIRIPLHMPSIRKPPKPIISSATIRKNGDATYRNIPA